MVVGALGLSLVSCGSKTDGNTGASKNKEETPVVEEQKEVVVGTSVAVVQILDKLGVKVSGVPTSSYELPESTKGIILVILMGLQCQERKETLPLLVIVVLFITMFLIIYTKLILEIK